MAQISSKSVIERLCGGGLKKRRYGAPRITLDRSSRTVAAMVAAKRADDKKEEACGANMRGLLI